MWIVCINRVNHINSIVPVLFLTLQKANFRLRFSWLYHVISWFCALTTSLSRILIGFILAIHHVAIFWLVVFFSHLIARHFLMVFFAQHISWNFLVGHFSFISHVTRDRSFTPISTSHARVMIFYTNLAWIFMYFISNVDSYLPPPRFPRVGGSWDWTQDCFDFDIWRSDILTTHHDLIRPRLGLIRTRLGLIHTRLDLIHTRQDLIHNSARSHPHSAKSHTRSARSHPQLA